MAYHYSGHCTAASVTRGHLYFREWVVTSQASWPSWWTWTKLEATTTRPTGPNRASSRLGGSISRWPGRLTPKFDWWFRSGGFESELEGALAPKSLSPLPLGHRVFLNMGSVGSTPIEKTPHFQVDAGSNLAGFCFFCFFPIPLEKSLLLKVERIESKFLDSRHKVKKIVKESCHLECGVYLVPRAGTGPPCISPKPRKYQAQYFTKPDKAWYL